MQPRTTKTKKINKTVKVDELPRVEGEGSLYLNIVANEVKEVKLKIYEPPRFFEGLLRGRKYSEAPDITSRICGICPVAYQMSSVHAMESIFGVKVEGQLRELRRLIYCGEWIESHSLHVYLLHAPDFLGYPDAIRMAGDHGPAVLRGLRLKKLGNRIMEILGGREVHPINVRVGGFYRVPRKQELEPLKEELKWAIDASLETVRLTAGFDFPDFKQDYEFVALRHPSEYPLNEGRLVSNKGLDIPAGEWENHFIEEQVEHSNALHGLRKDGSTYFVGPNARYSLNFDRLTPLAQQAAREAGLEAVCCNAFQSPVIRAVELVYACQEALRIIEGYEPPEKPTVDYTVRAGVGSGCTEAPRGILYHRYRLNERGEIMDARIVPPTAQNLPRMEEDLREFAPGHMDEKLDLLTLHCEQLVRNYDPCISCATHFLKVDIQRS